MTRKGGGRAGCITLVMDHPGVRSEAVMRELARSTVTAQEQISVPAEVRKRFGIQPGCELIWYEEDGRLIVDLTRTPTIADVRAALARRPTRGTAKGFKAAIRAHVSHKFKHAGR